MILLFLLFALLPENLFSAPEQLPIGINGVQLGVSFGSTLGGSGAVPFSYQTGISAGHPIYPRFRGRGVVYFSDLSTSVANTIRLLRGEYRVLYQLKTSPSPRDWSPSFFLGIGATDFRIRAGSNPEKTFTGRLAYVPIGFCSAKQLTQILQIGLHFEYNGVLGQNVDFEKYGPQGFISMGVGLSICPFRSSPRTSVRPEIPSRGVPVPVATPEKVAENSRPAEPAIPAPMAAALPEISQSVETAVTLARESNEEPQMERGQEIAGDTITGQIHVPAETDGPEPVVIESAPETTTQSKAESLLSSTLPVPYNKTCWEPTFTSVLDSIAVLLRRNPGLKVEIQGHTDKSGSRDYNIRLSYLRTYRVRDYLHKQGVSSEQLHCVGYGFENPIASNATPEGRSRNRRIEFRRLENHDSEADFSTAEDSLRVGEQLFRSTDGFQYNSAEITSAMHAFLDTLASYMLANENMRFEIQGHTDDIGSWKYNQLLSQRRAESVRRYLQKKGVDGASLTAVGVSSDSPLADNQTASGRRQNRRIEIFRIE